MRRRLSDESGIALITAILVIVVMMGIGIAAVDFADGQQRGSQQERTRESSFNLGEAALNAQVYQLGNSWPTSTSPATSPCTPTAATGTCPDPTGLANGYSAGDYTANGCPKPLWKTVVHDDINGSTYYNPATLDVPGVAAYDANNDGYVWVRSTTFAQCHEVTMVALVSRVMIPLSFPQAAVTANWFKTGNNGAKTIVNTQGQASQSGSVYLRCNPNLTATQCESYRAGQVSPDTVAVSPNPANTATLTSTQLASLKAEAQMAGTYWPNVNGSCPTGSQLSSPTSGILPGAPVYVEGPCNLSGGANSSANPGVLVLINGTYTMGSTNAFYGLLYLSDAQGTAYPTPVVTLGGCSKLYGMINIDNNGGVNVGQCGSDVTYDPRALSNLRIFSGATIVRNSFRVLPAGALPANAP